MTTHQANIFQIKLIKESGLDPFEWIVKYAHRFREVVNRGIEDYEKLQFIIYLTTNEMLKHKIL